MIKKDYIDRIYEKGEVSRKDITYVINELFNLMAEDLRNEEKITISNFGSFEVSKTKPIDIYSPYDGKLLPAVVQKRIHFKSSNFIKKE